MNESNIHKMKTDRAWKKLHSRLAEDSLLVEPKKRQYRSMDLIKYGVVAAAVISCLVYGVTTFLSSDEKIRLQDLITQENPEKSSLVTTLEDGSIVYLAQQSTLKYPVHFESDGRNVLLQGDAFFDITKNQERPFMIETESVRIKVLGTAFDVRSDNASSFSLSVQRGCVSVFLKENGETVYVKAGEMASLQGNRLSVGRQRDDASFDKYWKNIRFKDESLENILRVVNLNSPYLKIIAPHTLGERKLTVEFSDNSPEVIAELIRLALNSKCMRQGNNLLLSE